MKEKLVLESERVTYTDRNGNEKEAINYYVIIKIADKDFKIGLRTTDYTASQLLKNYLETK